jgi:FtsH-binding integral membrane protein
MNIESNHIIALGIAFLVVAFLRIYNPRNFSKKKGDNKLRSQKKNRTENEQRAGDNIRAEMFGSVTATLIANLLACCVALAMALCMLLAPWLFGIPLAYIAFGVYLSLRMTNSATGDRYNRLPLDARIWYHFVYALLWPIIIFIR